MAVGGGWGRVRPVCVLTQEWGSAARAGTFESVRGSRSKVLVGVKLQSQLSVRLLQIFFTCIFGNAQNFVKVLTVLNPAETRHNS